MLFYLRIRATDALNKNVDTAGRSSSCFRVSLVKFTVVLTQAKRRRRDHKLAHPEGERPRAGRGG